MNFTINLTDRELCLYFLSEHVVRIFKMFPFGKIFITSLKVHVALKWWTLEFQGGLGDLECSFASEHASIFHLLICVFCMVFCALFFHLSLFCAGYFWKLLKPHQKFSGPLLLYLHILGIQGSEHLHVFIRWVYIFTQLIIAKSRCSVFYLLVLEWPWDLHIHNPDQAPAETWMTSKSVTWEL